MALHIQKTSLITVLAGLIIISSWKQSERSPIQQVQWFIGTWVNRSENPATFESWSSKSDFEMVAKSYFLKSNDTVVFETIRIVQEPGNLYYIPVVKNQNNDSPVRFALKNISKYEVTFENAAHDFPQRIAYKRIGADSLVAEISGTNKGLTQKRYFPMKRIDK